MRKRISIFLFLATALLLYVGCSDMKSPVEMDSGLINNQPQFNLSLPAGVSFESATLSIYQDRLSGITIEVLRLTSDWTEGDGPGDVPDFEDVTWNHRTTSTPWTYSLGGDFATDPGTGNPIVYASFFTGDAGWIDIDISNLVQYWLENPLENYGLLLRSISLDQGRTGFYSSEYNVISMRPKLVINYTGGSMTIQRGTNGFVWDSGVDSHPDFQDWNFGASSPDLAGLAAGLLTVEYPVNSGLNIIRDKRSFIKFEMPDVPQNGPGTGTPGYWMNHPEAWPYDQITVGGVLYTKDDAIQYMKAPVKKDKTFTMFPALVAAMLNVEIGNDASCIQQTIADADAWMGENPLGSGVKGSSLAWINGEPLYWMLDDYNNGLLCAPSRDSLE